MTAKTIAASGLALYLVLLMAVSPRAHAQSEDLKKRAQALQVEGVGLLQKGEHRAALAKFNEAFALVQSPKILFNMGKAYRALGDDVEALKAFDVFLDEAPFAPKVSRNDAQREVEVLRLKLAYIEVQTEDTGSTIRIDGREAGKAPLARPVVVLPGSHDVRIEKPGMVAETRTVAPIAGQKLRVVVKLTLVPPPAEKVAIVAPPVVSPTPLRRRTGIARSDTAAPPPPLETSSEPADQGPAERPGAYPWQTKAAWIAAGVGVLSLGVGITGQVLWSQKNAQFNDVPDSNGGLLCNQKLTDKGGDACQALDRAANQRLTLAIAGYAGAAVALTGSLIFFLVSPGRGDSTHAGSAMSAACMPTASSGLACALTSRF